MTDRIKALGKCAVAALGLTLLAGCASGPTASNGIDVDLTKLSSTMVYSEVYNMMNEPETYVGKTVKMAGNLNVFGSEETNKMYYACVVADATACCASGIEFEWKGEHDEADYPDENSIITVEGTFDKYEENGKEYYHLRDADMKF